MANYLKIIEEFFPQAVVRLSTQDPSVYGNIIWDSTQVSQATLDTYTNKTSRDSIIQFGDKIGDGSAINPGINSTGSAIPAGTPVYSTGTDTLTGRALIAPADSSVSAKMPTIGITINTILSGNTGLFCSSGILKDIIDTSTFSAGNVLYVDSGGGLTNIKPTESQWQKVGIVRTVSSLGIIDININGLENSFTQRSIDIMMFGLSNSYYRSSTATTYTTAARFIFRGTKVHGTPINVKVIGWIGNATKQGNIRLYDITNSTVIATSAGFSNTAAAIIDLGAIANLPVNAAIFEFQIITNNVSSATNISSGHIYFN